jgi:hypothetical protein
VNARLERAVERGAARIASRLFKSIHLGVRLTRTFVGALAEHHAFVRYDACTHNRVRRRAAKPTARMLDRSPHPPFVVYHFS